MHRRGLVNDNRRQIVLSIVVVVVNFGSRRL